MLKLSKFTKILKNGNELIIFNTYNGSRSRLFDDKYISLANKMSSGLMLDEKEVDIKIKLNDFGYDSKKN